LFCNWCRSSRAEIGRGHMRSHSFRVAALFAGIISPGAAAADEGVDRYWTYKGDPPPTFSWTGFYVGAHVGGAFSDTRFEYAGTPLSSCVAVTGSEGDCAAHGDVSSNSVAGGVEAGFNKEIGRFVWGVESDMTWRGHDTGRATFLP